ncbi:hypothetical protein V8G56_11990 [Gaetbulibacter aquiaggeris]|uniref:Lipocalin-like domain-containing protein n=1 Tax=Gaetbulibacter aquiaggeris TaxID=1735373 RepID=A0ABW7MRM6_9FLAO
MTRLTLLLFVIIVLGCKPNDEKSDLILGTWDCISVFDFETQEISQAPSGEKFIAEFKSDSLYLRSIDNNTEYDAEIYAWQIKEDSLFLDELGSIYIKELSKNNLIVEHELFGKQRLTFIKIK